MLAILFGGLLLGAAAAQPQAVHSVRLDHVSGPVHAQYRGDVTIRHRQTGSVAPGGRASTLRCTWAADLTVEREARHGSGILSRSLRRDRVLKGNRPGWCGQHKAAIAEEVARQDDVVRAQMLALAEQDSRELHAEVDRLVARTQG